MEPSETSSPLRFDKAQFGEHETAVLSCAFCQCPIASSYYEVGGKTACEGCRSQVERPLRERTAFGRLFRALAGGGAGGLLGAGIYYAVLALTGYEIGLVAIVVGLLVGFGVRWGSGGVGGRGYQVLAVAITYLAIVSTYVPFIVEEIQSQVDSTEAGAEVPPAEAPAPEGAEAVLMLGVALVAVMVLAMLAPFLSGIQNVLGLLIIGFALYEAWRVNAYSPLAIEGPFQIGSTCDVPTAGPRSPRPA